jgi:pimeloyl-ACP methyl ester carboxylesterase
MAARNPVIVIPGITASSLRDGYAVDPEAVWGVLRKDELRVALHPDDLRYELVEPARVEADAVFRLIYGSLIEELRTELGTRDQRTPVYPFPYDWRLPLEATAARLEAFIDEVIGRTSLLRHYHREKYHDNPAVDVVAHSMGGLVLAGYLARAKSKSRIGRVVTIATPFRGSIEAPVKVATGTADLGEAHPSNPRDRFAARLTPALYHLLPSYPDAIQIDPALGAASLFDVDAWQPSVVDSIADAIHRYGPEPPSTVAARRERAREVLSDMLQQAADFIHRVDRLSLDRSNLGPDRWLCIVGVNAETRVRLPILSNNGRPFFELRSRDREDRWDPARYTDEERMLTGDNTVPIAGALPAFIPAERIVCLRPGDFGYWEVRDRALRQVAGFHGAMPTMNIVHRLAAAFLLDEPQRKGLFGCRVPGVAEDAWDPPLRGLRDRTQ